MFARVTRFHIDTVTAGLEAALARLKLSFRSQAQRQPGRAGASVTQTAVGKGASITSWATFDAARAGVGRGYRAHQIESFLTFDRQPPGREHDEAVLMGQLPMARASA